MATAFELTTRTIPSGETIVTAPPQVTRCGAITISIDGDQFPGDPDLQFLTVIVERSTDGFVNDIFEVARFTRTGKARPQTTDLRIQLRNRDEFEIPIEGRIRLRLIVKSPFRSAVRARVEDAVDPPPLTPVPNSVAHDGEANVFGVVNFVNSITLSSKTTAGSDRCGIAHVNGEITAGATTLTGVTWGGVSMTQIGTGAYNGTQADAYLYRLVAPATGASSVVASFGDDVRATMGASSYNGVDQTTPVQSGSPVTHTGTASGTPTVNVTSAAGNMVVDSIFYDAAAALTQGASQTLVGSEKTTVGGDLGGGGSYEAGASTVTMSWSTADAWALIAASLVAASGGGGGGGGSALEESQWFTAEQQTNRSVISVW